jgi:hypothetical protein
MLARVLSAAVNGIEAFPVGAEVNSGWEDAAVAMTVTISPKKTHSDILVSPQNGRLVYVRLES